MIPSLLAVAAAALSGVSLAHPYLPPLPAPRRDAARLNGGRTVEDIRRDLIVARKVATRPDHRQHDAATKRRQRNLWLVNRGGLQAVAR